MNWIVLFMHAFNPLLMAIGLNETRESETQDKNIVTEKVIAVVFTSFLTYLLWLAIHYLIVEMFGSGFHYNEFLGVGKSVPYFLPFIFGFGLLVVEVVIHPRVRSLLGLVALRTIGRSLMVVGCYFMLINYMAWLTQ